MSADLCIHIFELPVTEDDLADFFSSHLGSKYFSWQMGNKTFEEKYGGDSPYERISKSPNVWVGEVSWAKQAFVATEDGEYVPDVVAGIHDLIGEDLPTIDESFIDSVREIYDKAANHSYYRTETPKVVIDFLKSHTGKKVFTVSW